MNGIKMFNLMINLHVSKMFNINDHILCKFKQIVCVCFL